MSILARTASLTALFVFGFTGFAPAQEPPAAKPQQKKAETTKGDETAKAVPPKTELATFGGGCFWCQEAVFERLPGVKAVVSGYSGGTVPNPTYQMVSSHLTGHAEVIQIEFDPAVIPFEKLLDVFWMAHDPTTLNSQGVDEGPQYRSIILYHSEAQKKAVQASLKNLKARKVFRRPIVTEVVPFQAFYPAEDYHQDYYRNNRYADYSQFHIVPKLRDMNKKLKNLK